MLLQGKKALILGLANNKSIAYGIANAFKDCLLYTSRCV